VDEWGLTIDDLEALAARRLPKTVYDYYRAGADAEVTLRANRDAFARLTLWPRVLVDVTERRLATTLLGEPLATPVLVAPTAYHKLAHPEGECATARAASKANAVFVLSMLSTIALEEVAAASSGPKWLQLYVHKDRGITAQLVARAEQAGYRALVLTVDAPVLGRRLVDERNRFSLPTGLIMANLTTQDESTETDGSQLAAYAALKHDTSLGWHDLAWLRSLSRLPVVVKGVLRPDDAVRAVDAGVAAVIVSNHGGRQLDGAPAALDALPGIVDTVRGRCEILVDGGVRAGTDILKALALGARAVLIGRPILWGLAVGGAAGVTRAFDILHDELTRAMALAGVTTVTSVPRDLVQPAPATPR
jgi:4-hydroxymandelate oxidase